MNEKKARWMCRLFFGLAGTAGCFFLLVRALVPGGQINYSYDMDQDSFFISRLEPPARVELDSGQALIKGDPVYFNLRLPRRFDRAFFSISYQDSGAELIEFGPLVDQDLWRYRLQPLANRLLDRIDMAWPSLKQDDLRLWQRPGSEFIYDNIGDFLAKPPAAEKVAVYNYDWQPEYDLPDYQPAAAAGVLDFDLRGAWQAFVYISQEDLSLSMEIIDLNQNQDPDPVELRLYYRQELLTVESLPDDGDSTDSGHASPARTLAMRQAGLPAGVYKLELRANSDIVSRQIRPAQAKFVFINSLELHRSGAGDLRLWTDSRAIQAVTAYPDSRQAILAGAAILSLDQTYRQFRSDVVRAGDSGRIAEIVLEKDGLKIAGDCMFAPSPSAWFNPNPARADHLLDVNGQGIDFILAAYQPRPVNGQSRTAELAVDLRDAYREQGRYSFIISVPGLDPDQSGPTPLIIENISVVLQGRTLKEKINDYFR